MSLQKFDANATTKTHGAVDATLIDVINPTVPLVGSLENGLRAAFYGVVGWVGRGYRDTKSFSL